MIKGRGGSLSTGGKGVHEREVDDFYATQSKTTKALLDNYICKGSSFLEPACGMGHISEVLKEYFPDAEIVSTDLVDRGYGEGEIDFLTHEYGRKFDIVITNPPFSLAKEFVEKGLEISNNNVIMLLKIQFLETKKRKEFLKGTPLKYVYVFSERQSTLMGGLERNPANGKPWSTTLLLAWYIWEQGYTGEPIIRWL